MKTRPIPRMCANASRRAHGAPPTRKQIARWKQRTPAENLASSHYSRAKRANGGKPNGYWTARQWERLCERAGWRCAYCRTPTRQLSPDHIQPLALGGTNHIWNIAPVCRSCQQHKAARAAWDHFTFDEFVALLRWLHPERARDVFDRPDNAGK